MATEPLIVRENADRHRFEIDLGGDGIAIAEYTLPAGKIMFTHTEVPEAHEGKGIGTALIRHALDAARERGLKVIPICPFFAAYMQKHAEVQDLLDPAWRKKFGLED
jgi:uncharacterized protein